MSGFPALLSTPNRMTDRERTLKLFDSNPPRLQPGIDYHYPVIEGLLAQLAAIDPGRYEERLAKYNEMCDKAGVKRFPRVTIAREEEPAPQPVPQPTAPTVTEDVVVPVPVAESVEITEAAEPAPQPVKGKGGKKK